MSFAEELRMISDEIMILKKNGEVIENIKEICIKAAMNGDQYCNVLCDVNIHLKNSLKKLGLNVKYIYENDLCECISQTCSCDSNLKKGYVLYW